MSACAQLIIAFLLILLQLGIIVALFIMEPPEVSCLYLYLMVLGKVTLSKGRSGHAVSSILTLCAVFTCCHGSHLVGVGFVSPLCECCFPLLC